MLGQDIERAVVVSVLEYATTRVMPEKLRYVIFNIEGLLTIYKFRVQLFSITYVEN